MNISSTLEWLGLKCQCFLASLRVQRALVNVFSFQQQPCVVAFQVGKGEKKNIWGRETVLWCQRGASFNFFSSFFKLILQGYAAWGRSDLFPEIPPIPPHKRAYQPRRVFRYLNATPWFHWTPPAALPNCFATSQTRSTGMGQRTDDGLLLKICGLQPFSSDGWPAWDDRLQIYEHQGIHDEFHEVKFGKITKRHFVYISQYLGQSFIFIFFCINLFLLYLFTGSIIKILGFIYLPF